MAEDANRLIVQAFGQARAAGKPDWFRMTTAVLKNRLLNLTGNAFNEADYGAANFTVFLSERNDLVDIDRSRTPPLVKLREAHLGDIALGDTEPVSILQRVRSDLWRAVLDYSSGTEYVWDKTEGQARASQPADENPILPSVTRTVHQQWREEFLNTVGTSASITSEQEQQAIAWAQQQLPTSHLPVPLIPQWNRFLRDNVHQLLLNWFQESGLEPPSDLVTSVVERRTRRTPEAEALRRLVLRVVGEMTEHELASLNLPSRAVLKATRPRQP